MLIIYKKKRKPVIIKVELANFAHGKGSKSREILHNVKYDLLVALQ